MEHTTRRKSKEGCAPGTGHKRRGWPRGLEHVLMCHVLMCRSQRFTEVCFVLSFHACWVTMQAVAAAAPERGAPAGGVPGRAGAAGAYAGQRPALARHAICAGVHVFQPGRGRGQPVRCLAARQWHARNEDPTLL